VRALLQRVTSASVSVDGAEVGAIHGGILVLLGVAPGDTEATARELARKTVALRIFEDSEGKMNRSVVDAGGAVICVSQFTLYGDTRKGNRPSFTGAAAPEHANELYERFCEAIAAQGVRCERGVFGAHMVVSLVNDGPVTVLLDSDELNRPRRG
jgi:D-aminoacyl-tRNA deacylase